MKYYLLKSLLKIFNNYKKLKRVKRVDNNLFRLDFPEKSWFIDVTKSNGLIYPEFEKQTLGDFNSPFDVNLEKFANGSLVKSVELLNEDKLLCFNIEKQGSYKTHHSKLIFELTGKHTNVVLVGEDEKIISSLRIIGESMSIRQLKIGQFYTLPPKPNFTFSDGSVENLEEFLEGEARKRVFSKVENYKKSKLDLLEKKLNKLKKEISKLEDPKKILEKAEKFSKDGETLLIHISNIKGYEKTITLKTAEEEERKIDLIPEFSPQQTANFYYKKSKREKNRANNLHIEKQGLEERCEFLKKLKQMAKKASSIGEIKILFPENKKEKKKKENTRIANFEIGGFKVMVGKNKKGNIELLKEAKAEDLWFHIKDIPSSHLIIRSNKQKIPPQVIDEAAKLCVKFSCDKEERFLVDYTKRRNVRVQEGANVLYTEYKTVKV
ncbi:MAG: NFACT RNA binding domain-containing protein [Campylobacterales bacterium]|nr:NFACT RNA binding domain-containing protein [Campylobacterales bacterium]